MTETVATTAWRKSSFSSGGASNCVEAHRQLAWLRDSKNPGAVLKVPVGSLINAIRLGRL